MTVLYQPRRDFWIDAAVLVSRGGGRRVNSRGELARLRRLSETIPRSRNAAFDLLIQLAEYESGMLDAVNPDQDGVNPTSSALRAITEEAAVAWLAIVDRDEDRRHGGALTRRLTQFEALRLPHSVELRDSERDEDAVARAERCVADARLLAAETGARRVHAIGIRGGAAWLSAVFAAALRRGGCTVSTSTMRPPEDAAGPALATNTTLESLWRREAAHDAWFAVVDGGCEPGGSSFGAVAAYLGSLDIPASRITIVAPCPPTIARRRSAASTTS